MILFPPTLTMHSPLDDKAFQARCAELSKAKDWQGLEALARGQAAADPKDAAAQAALGFALLAQDKTEDGRKACEASIHLDPKNEKPYIYLGLSYAQAKDRDGVIKTGQRLSDALPFAVRNYYEVTVIAEASGADPHEPFDRQDQPATPASGWPPYPPEARTMNAQGVVVVEVHVGPDGIPVSTAALAGPPQLTTLSILEFGKHFRFKPLLKGGAPVPFRTLLYCTFRLENKVETIVGPHGIGR